MLENNKDCYVAHPSGWPLKLDYRIQSRSLCCTQSRSLTLSCAQVLKIIVRMSLSIRTRFCAAYDVKGIAWRKAALPSWPPVKQAVLRRMHMECMHAQWLTTLEHRLHSRLPFAACEYMTSYSVQTDKVWLRMFESISGFTISCLDSLASKLSIAHKKNRHLKSSLSESLAT